MTSLLLVPLDDTVVFPTMDVTLPVDVGDEERVLLIPRHDNEFAAVGTIAEVTDRLALAVKIQRERLTELQLRRKIRDDVQSGADKQQREYFLRKQMESIQRELGEDAASVVEEYRTKIAEAGMPEAVAEQATKELGRLERMGEQSAEATTIRSYLDWLIALPRGERPAQEPQSVDAPARAD